MWTLFCNPHRNGDNDEEQGTTAFTNKGVFTELGPDEDLHSDEQYGGMWKTEGYLSGCSHRRNDTMTTCPTSDIEDRGFDDEEDDDDDQTLQYSSDGCSFDPLEFEILKAHVESTFRNRHLNYFGDMSCVSSCSSFEADKEWDDDGDHDDLENEQVEERPVFVWRRLDRMEAFAEFDDPLEENNVPPLPAIEIERFADNASVISRFSSSVVDDLTHSAHGGGSTYASFASIDDVGDVDDGYHAKCVCQDS